jgi:hypothetical protein
MNIGKGPLGPPPGLEYDSEMQDFYKSEVVLLNTMDVDHWLAALRQIRDSGLSAPESKLNARFDGSLTSYMLENDWYGYVVLNLRS